MNKAKLILIILIAISLIIIIYTLMNSPRKKIVRLAKEEAQIWNGKLETDPEMRTHLLKYWRDGAGWNWVNNTNIQEYDNEYPWSSSGLSYIVRKAHPIFPKSSSHSKYTLWAKARKEAGAKNIIAHKPTEYISKPGDIILKTRGAYSGDLDSLYEGATTHGDIVIENNNSFVKAIGFNLGNTVKEIIYPAQNGRITDPRHFAVIQM